MTAVQATGKIKTYQIVVGSIQLLILPISYIYLKLDYTPEITLYIAIVMESIALIFRLLFLKKLINFPIYTFIKEIIFKNIIIVILSISLPLSIRNILDVSTLRLLIIVVLSLIWSALIIYLIGLNKKEKTIIKKGIQKVLSRSQI